MNKAFVLILCLHVLQIKSMGLYNSWIPKCGHRTDLKCPMDYCTISNYRDIEDCCVCHSKPQWQLSSNTIVLEIEYTRRYGCARIMGDVNETSRLMHIKGFLTKFPSNLCDFRNIVEIDVRHNTISDIIDLSCLELLDTIDMSYNEIVAVRNSSFVNLPYLRVVRITHNKIATLEPFSLARPTMTLFDADLSYNHLTQLDISNMIPENNFCKYDFSSNQIAKMVNLNNFALNTSKVYVGGHVNLNSNLFTKFIDFSYLGINDIQILGKLLYFEFSFLDMKLDCDCHMQPYMELAEFVLKQIWRDYFNLTCWNPPEYRGLSIPDFFVRPRRFDLLICNITSAEKCPRNCYCFYQPSNKITVVNCTGAGLTSLPEYMPDSSNLTILLTDNHINKFESRDYLNKTFSLDLLNNTIQSLPYDALSLLHDDVLLDLKDNKLEKLPRYLQKFDPCVVKFGTITIKCDCNDVWIGDWMRNRRAGECKNVTEIFCRTDKCVVPTLDLTPEIICKDYKYSSFVNILLPALLAIVLVTVGLIYTCRYEIYLLRRKWTRTKPYKIQPVLKFDVFFSFFDDNVNIRTWIIQQLDPYLRLHGYKSFIPCRDGLFGEMRDDALTKTISGCKNYVIVLSNSYLSSDNTWINKEWKYIWHNFKHNKERKIIIVNYDQLEPSQVRNAKIKAFLRIRSDIDFANRKKTILQDIRMKLGPISCSKTGLENALTKFLAHSHINKKELLTIEI